MIDRKLFEDFQKVCVTAVQTEALLHGIKEYSVEARRNRTKITIYARKFAASATLYISGRLVIEETDSVGSGKYKVVSNTVYNNNSILSVSFLLRDVVVGFFGLMSDSLHTKLHDYYKAARERRLHNVDSTVVETVGTQYIHQAENALKVTSAPAFKPPYIEVSPESYLDEFEI